MTLLATILLLALTRAEIIERMKAPVITQCNGFVQVFADCPEDMRREYQMPIASFAADTVNRLRQSGARQTNRYARAGIIIHVGDVRTNLAAVVTRAVTNASGVVNRIYVPSPGYADVGRLRLEVVKAFLRTTAGIEADDAAATAAYRKADPRFRILDERARLDRWLHEAPATSSPEDDEDHLALMRRVLEPGVASRTDVQIFASRLFLYPQEFDRRFCGRFDCLSFREAVRCVKADPFVRLAAYRKAGMVIITGGGRGDLLSEASKLYFEFLMELARAEKTEDELLDMLEAADVKLNLALENAGRRE